MVTRDADRENWTQLKRRAATGVAISTEKGVNLSQDDATEWWPRDADRETYTKWATRLNIE